MKILIPILILAGRALLIALGIAAIIGGVGRILGWQGGTNYSNVFFIGGAVLAGIGSVTIYSPKQVSRNMLGIPAPQQRSLGGTLGERVQHQGFALQLIVAGVLLILLSILAYQILG